VLEWGGSIGALKAGYYADVVAVPGDPLADITVLAAGGVRDEGRVVYKR